MLIEYYQVQKRLYYVSRIEKKGIVSDQRNDGAVSQKCDFIN